MRKLYKSVDCAELRSFLLFKIEKKNDRNRNSACLQMIKTSRSMPAKNHCRSKELLNYDMKIVSIISNAQY